MLSKTVLMYEIHFLLADSKRFLWIAHYLARRFPDTNISIEVKKNLKSAEKGNYLCYKLGDE